MYNDVSFHIPVQRLETPATAWSGSPHNGKHSASQGETAYISELNHRFSLYLSYVIPCSVIQDSYRRGQLASFPGRREPGDEARGQQEGQPEHEHLWNMWGYNSCAYNPACSLNAEDSWGSPASVTVQIVACMVTYIPLLCPRVSMQVSLYAYNNSDQLDAKLSLCVEHSVSYMYLEDKWYNIWNEVQRIHIHLLSWCNHLL